MSRSGTSERRVLGRRGATALEFAVVANVLLLLLVGGFDTGRYFFVNESLKYFVGELARGVVLSPDADWNTKKYTLISRAPILKADAFSTLDVNINRAAAPAVTTVTVTASYHYSFALPVMSGLVNSINTALTLKFVAP